MRYIALLLAAFFMLPAALYAAPATLQNLYINPEGKHLPEAVIFYSSADTCETCPETINKLIAVLKQNYQGKLHAYLIDTARRPEFISALHLSGPLNLVIIRISDGAAFGYRKLSGVQSLNGSPAAFSRRIIGFIHNFLGF